MVKFYVSKIQAGTITIEDVPKLWRKKVEAELVKEQEPEEEREKVSKP